MASPSSTDVIYAPSGSASEINPGHNERIEKVIENFHSKGAMIPDIRSEVNIMYRETSEAKPEIDYDTQKIMEMELKKVREDIVRKVDALEKGTIERFEAKYGAHLAKKEAEIQTARRIINIQNYIVSQIFNKNKEVLLRVLEESDITQEDLEILSMGGGMLSKD
jgi:hypothetical protein